MDEDFVWWTVRGNYRCIFQRHRLVCECRFRLDNKQVTYNSGHFHTTSRKKKRSHLQLNLFQNLNCRHLNFAGRRDRFIDQSKLKPIQCWKQRNILIMDYSEVRSILSTSKFVLHSSVLPTSVCPWKTTNL